MAKYKTFKISRNQLLLFRAMQKMGSKKVFLKDWNAKINKKRLMEYSGSLDFDKTGLEKYIVDGKSIALDEEEAADYSNYNIYSPRVIEDTEDYEFNFHTHPGNRNTFIEPIHLGDIQVFIEANRDKNKTQGELVFAPEGIYLIRCKNQNRISKNIPEEDEAELDDKEMDIFENANDYFVKVFNKRKNKNKLKYIYKFVSKYIKRKVINKMNKLYSKYNIYLDFFPVKYNKRTKVWSYSSIKLPVKVVE